MKAILFFDIKAYLRNYFSYLALAILFAMGLFAGYQFNLSVGEGIYLNSAYTIGFMTGFLSLSIVFIATILGSQLLFKEWDARFEMLLFTTPLRKNNYLLGRLLAYLLLVLSCFTVLYAGFVIAQNSRRGVEIQHGLYVIRYLYAYVLFGIPNTILVGTLLFFIALRTQRKMLLVLGGLLLYILYMVLLVFSNSPFMNASLPQSEWAQQVSALADPFGLSSYFFQARHFNVDQRNNQLVPLTDFLLLNRLLCLAISASMLASVFRLFSFSSGKTQRGFGNKRLINTNQLPVYNEMVIVQPVFAIANRVRAVLSFAKLDIRYVFKTIFLPASALLLLFYSGMEMYAEIEKGIRMPQKYVTSGLMASSIHENFHLLASLLVTYFVHELYWRSRATRFSLVENSTYYSSFKFAGHVLAMGLLILFFSVLMIAEGIVFQFCYEYPLIDYAAYAGVFLFNSLPLWILAILLLLINRVIQQRYVALAASVLFTLCFPSPLSTQFIRQPLLGFLNGYNGAWSDFTGYGVYANSFAQRLLFGASIVIALWVIAVFFLNRKRRMARLLSIVPCVLLAFFSGRQYMIGYIAKDRQLALANAAQYEKQYRKYQLLPSPTITAVKTQVDLYPNERRYTIRGTYTLRNQSQKEITQILLGFPERFKIEKALFSFGHQQCSIKERNTEIVLKKQMLPNDTALLEFTMSYRWWPVNGHDPVNAIMENGSFMRISRYYPSFGYRSGEEVQDQEQRKLFELGPATASRKLETPNENLQDFIQLDMMVSTAAEQTVVGTGELQKQWTQNGRNYFQFKSANIPFRFALASASYKIKSATHRGIPLNIYYHPLHHQNTDALLQHARLALDYCEDNFGAYPFASVSFAEISSFSRGFNATAYPSVIFMNEALAFNANIKADPFNDVINELAGHELAHFWWGNNQLSPDEREGAAFLTESFAMYTEMMLYKKKYGEQKMRERLKIHEQIYESEKGFSPPQALYRVTPENTHISYSRGAMVMVKISEILGEKRLNTILKEFLGKYKYPHRATTLDLLDHLRTNVQQEEYERLKELLTE